ncbi:MAG TPA: TonB-dependent receptor, partial [Salinivirgaceae bacterium]|nr:TonB-dependent receptor [Salinivirgaceae bacterium]
MQNRVILLLLVCLFSNVGKSQKATILGKILDTDKYPVEFATVVIDGQNYGTTSDALGRFELEVPANTDITLIVSCVGYERKTLTIHTEERKQHRLEIILRPEVKNIDEVRVVDEPTRHTTTQYLNPKFLKQMPGISDPISLVVKSQPGVATNNELSNQYSVRGGNYDENLIYVNGIEIYKPFLVRSGQQEGMSFINSDMIRSISFSSGGFDAKYGDKMSSVLDVEYRRPSKFQSKLDLGLLGGALLVEGATDNSRFSHLTGIRYKQTKNILGTLDTKGDYQPSFFDFQSLLTYDISENLELSFLAYVADNKFLFKPTVRETTFGLVNNVMRFKVYFEGQELDRFSTYQGSTALKFTPNEQNQFWVSLSSFYSSEKETYDILGEYWLNQIDANLGSSTLGDSLGSLAVGSYLDHARNYLNAWVSTLSISGQHKSGKHHLRWGASLKTDRINDETNEWKMLDSAGYSVPYYSLYDSTVNLFYVRRFTNQLNTLRLSSYAQDTWQFSIDSVQIYLTAGVRLHYLQYTDDRLFSPRATFAVRPSWNRDWLFRISSGVYYQPAFYKEFVTHSGTLNKNLKSQKSIHYVAGADYNFR